MAMYQQEVFFRLLIHDGQRPSRLTFCSSFEQGLVPAPVSETFRVRPHPTPKDHHGCHDPSFKDLNLSSLVVSLPENHRHLPRLPGRRKWARFPLSGFDAFHK